MPGSACSGSDGVAETWTKAGLWLTRSCADHSSTQSPASLTIARRDILLRMKIWADGIGAMTVSRHFRLFASIGSVLISFSIEPPTARNSAGLWVTPLTSKLRNMLRDVSPAPRPAPRHVAAGRSAAFRPPSRWAEIRREEGHIARARGASSRTAEKVMSLSSLKCGRNSNSRRLGAAG